MQGTIRSSASDIWAQGVTLVFAHCKTWYTGLFSSGVGHPVIPKDVLACNTRKHKDELH
jgi:hydrogenase/urease accessory protein HupE